MCSNIKRYFKNIFFSFLIVFALCFLLSNGHSFIFFISKEKYSVQEIWLKMILWNKYDECKLKNCLHLHCNNLDIKFEVLDIRNRELWHKWNRFEIHPVHVISGGKECHEIKQKMWTANAKRYTMLAVSKTFEYVQENKNKHSNLKYHIHEKNTCTCLFLLLLILCVNHFWFIKIKPYVNV